MAFTLFRKKDRTVNFIFTDYAIRFVELRQTDPVIVECYGERELPEGVLRNGDIVDYEAFVHILENCLTEWNVKKREARFAVPDNYIAIREEQLDEDLEEDEIKGYLFLQIGSTIHLPFDEPIFDAVVTGETNGKKEVLLIAAPEEQVRKFRELIEEVKLRPKAADIGPLSLYRFFYYQGLTDKNSHELILHVRRNLMTISIFHQHQPKFIKPVSLEVGEQSPLFEMGEGEVTQVMDALNEVTNVINFYENSVHKGNIQMDKVFISGDHPQLRFIENYVRETLGMSVVEQEHMEIVDKNGISLSRSYYDAVGLGLKEV
ncbi:MAG TPA: pilus assembly protein PilM [Chondromyces sp.]|nr:pilus assembly protein PilM [Chondromyces sp.]